ncbi:Hypothetical predicted protein [Octopus vulgaris]|uniref:Uncharacterized protein n=1 Tax=Octopus vulgaris TaxID=6645 RepID=A0AA36B3M3_OCTVU|nr:Hypothetical predicted protein [Octopus vulgaris]
MGKPTKSNRAVDYRLYILVADSSQHYTKYSLYAVFRASTRRLLRRSNANRENTGNEDIIDIYNNNIHSDTNTRNKSNNTNNVTQLKSNKLLILHNSIIKLNKKPTKSNRAVDYRLYILVADNDWKFHYLHTCGNSDKAIINDVSFYYAFSIVSKFSTKTPLAALPHDFTIKCFWNLGTSALSQARLFFLKRKPTKSNRAVDYRLYILVADNDWKFHYLHTCGNSDKAIINDVSFYYAFSIVSEFSTKTPLAALPHDFTIKYLWNLGTSALSQARLFFLKRSNANRENTGNEDIIDIYNNNIHSDTNTSNNSNNTNNVTQLKSNKLLILHNSIIKLNKKPTKSNRVVDYKLYILVADNDWKFHYLHTCGNSDKAIINDVSFYYTFSIVNFDKQIKKKKNTVRIPYGIVYCEEFQTKKPTKSNRAVDYRLYILVADNDWKFHYLHTCGYSDKAIINDVSFYYTFSIVSEFSTKTPFAALPHDFTIKCFWNLGTSALSRARLFFLKRKPTKSNRAVDYRLYILVADNDWKFHYLHTCGNSDKAIINDVSFYYAFSIETNEIKQSC